MPTVDLDQLDYVVPFKQFCDHLRTVHSRSHFDEDELQKRYQHYKEKVLARQLSSFFASNKDKQWFQEKYHPKLSKDRIDDTKRRRLLNLLEFQNQLNDGKYDEVNYDAPKAAQDTAGNDEQKDEAEAGNTSGQEDQDMSAVEYESHLIIKTVPPTIARQKIIEMCSGVEGFEYLVLSEPSPNKKFHRIGWIHFKQGTDMQKAFNELDTRKIDDFIFHLAMNQKNQYQSRTSKVTPEIASTPKRLQKDIEQAKQLAKHLESELGDDVNGLEKVAERAKQVIAKHTENKEDENWELKKELDMILAYLRHVHMYCYYCALECDSLEEINRRCVDPHLRKISGSGEEVDAKQSAKNDKNGCSQEQDSNMTSTGAQWAKNIDQKIAMKVNVPEDRELEKWGGKILKKELDSYVKEHVLKEHEAKYKCRVGDCTKAFKGFEYVEKHIFTKHNEEVDVIKEEVEYYNSYVCDPNHLVQANNPHMNNGSMGMGSMGNGMPISMSSFMMNMNGGMRAPPGLGHVQGATYGTPWDQIPRIGFGESNWAMGNRRDDGLPRDPRQVKSYVDLDAPAEGDADISFY
ncbi:hypothetical protein BJV82DRAFT_645835 [Fennellomyces sp. T-0311]|nr:hypothetical protein BJV82DRAFT_645835 [Fennellomyces sp. T-0311]